MTDEEKEILVRMRLAGFQVNSHTHLKTWLHKCPYDNYSPKEHSELGATYIAREAYTLYKFLVIRPCTNHLQYYLDCHGWEEI